MPDGANKGSFIQAYNAQIAVDAHAQVIVAANITQQANDKQQLEPMMVATLKNMGRMPDASSADAGYFSEKAIEAVEKMGTNLLVPSRRQKHGEPLEPAPSEPPSEAPTTSELMRAKLCTAAGRDLYRMRKAIVEPVFGQIKGVRGIRRFVVRGLENARAEFCSSRSPTTCSSCFGSEGREHWPQPDMKRPSGHHTIAQTIRPVPSIPDYGQGSSRGAAALPSNKTVTTEFRRALPDELLGAVLGVCTLIVLAGPSVKHAFATLPPYSA